MPSRGLILVISSFGDVKAGESMISPGSVPWTGSSRQNLLLTDVRTITPGNISVHD